MYYHVIVKKNGKEVGQFNIDKDDLIENIIKPYRKGKDFYINGVLCNKKTCEKFQIFETEQKAEELYEQEMEKCKKGSSVEVVVASYGKIGAVSLCGKDVTNDKLTM